MTDKSDTKKEKVVTLRPMGNKQHAKDISKEPEMIELKQMIRDGELDPDRTIDHLKEKEKNKQARNKLKAGAGETVLTWDS